MLWSTPITQLLGVRQKELKFKANWAFSKDSISNYKGLGIELSRRPLGLHPHHWEKIKQPEHKTPVLAGHGRHGGTTWCCTRPAGYVYLPLVSILSQPQAHRELSNQVWMSWWQRNTSGKRKVILSLCSKEMPTWKIQRTSYHGETP